MNEDFRPTASIETLQRRAKILASLRDFFDSRGFFEVQTPTLSRDTVVDRHIDPITVHTALPGAGPQDWYLQTSPEFAMKRLLASGAKAIYQMCPAFRADEVGNHHNLEFTMLEWYRVGDTYRQGIDLLDQLAQAILGCPPAHRMSYRQAFQNCGLDSDALNHPASPDDANTLNEQWVKQVEPSFQQYKSLIIQDWPADQAALAKVNTDGEQPFAERFELYVNGIELANGYHELTDAATLRARNRQNNQLRAAESRQPLPEESRLLAAMDHGLPDSCGVALGVDRLVMIALGKSSIAEIMSFDSRLA